MTEIAQITPESKKDGDPASVLGQLADLSAQEGYYGLQDANLVLVDVISGLPAATDLNSLLTAWTLLAEQYLAQPTTQSAKAIIAYLRRPELGIPMEDEEFAMLEQQLCFDANAPDAEETAAEIQPDPQATETPSILDTSSIALTRQSLDAHIANMEMLADQAAADGFYGLQDANLLLAEALRETDLEAVGADVVSMLAYWSELNKLYNKQPNEAINAIIAFLRQPTLNIPMGEDEFALLEEQMTIAADGNGPDQAANENRDDLPSAFIPSRADDDTFSEAFSEDFSEALSPVTQELVGLLLLETRQVCSCLENITIGNSSSVLESLQQTSEELERFANAAKTAGFTGLGQICLHINQNLHRFLKQIDLFTAENLELLLEWLAQVQDYLPSFNDRSAAQLIVSGLADEQWPVPMALEELSGILMQIRAESSSVEDQSEAEREQAARSGTATDEDVSLALPGDVNQELLEILLQELPIQTQQFSEAVQRMQTGSSEALEIAQRVAHTLKGSANTVGIKGIAVLTHNLEDILTVCANGQKLPGRTLSNALVNAADCLEAMSEALMGFSPPPDDAKAVLQEILDWANRIDKDGIPDSDTEGNEITATIDSGAGLESVEKPVPAAAPITMMRVPANQIENLFRLSGENIILNSQANETLRRMKKQLQTIQLQFSHLQQLSAELEQLVDLKDLSGQAVTSTGPDFDALEMDQYNELHTASRRLIEAAVDAREMSLDVQKELEQMDEVLDYQQRLMLETQESIMKTRLVSVATISPRLQRALRQTCRLTGKQSDLSLSGEELLIDSDMLHSMVDPLMHLLRNAVDHGIENEADRLQLGKAAQGHISIRFEREGNNILVSCQDDGQGLDFNAIRAAAERRGVLAPDQEASEDDLKRFILRPNFSTRTQSTQTSGRGVGMDVVYFQVVNLGGTLGLHSRRGQGLTVELRMPLPLSRSHALLANAGPYRVAIASKGIKQVLYSGPDDFATSDGQAMLRLEDKAYPVLSLNTLLHVPQNPRQMHTNGVVLLVQNGDDITAVLLDSVTDSLDIVIKNFGYYLKKIPGYLGAAIMGDGLVAPVLDVPELLRTSVAAWNLDTIEAIEIEEPKSLLPTILLVDDSLSQRRALEQLLEDAGFNTISARDGIEAVNLLQQIKPDLVLTDLEMPRMNGIELTAHIRSKAAIKTLPVIMITSRTTQKHRMMAEGAGINFYLVKPVREDELLAKMQMLMEASVS
ncbi:MAG: response regulator [Methylovulum sp.]|uniref:hybrid sensor histidine kinase/response regulator n=1 Tax=Methylovulum sp. TaxID=1916980 RepID=UPI0026217599|nr:response regulator [Methylovulum sp.]MDD2723172.1 response regulator [Methylovulum sp.]MDD5124648.1 response regulator [Methylovulum sp.]